MNAGASSDDVTGLRLTWSQGDRGALDRLVPLEWQRAKIFPHRELETGSGSR